MEIKKRAERGGRYSEGGQDGHCKAGEPEKEGIPSCPEDVVLQALRCICGGDLGRARELLGRT